VIERLLEPVMMLGIHASMIVAVVALLTRWTNVGSERVLAIIGATAILLFVICIGIPFFFQGYASGTESTPLGWTRNPAIGLFAYIYTFEWTGFAWLVISIVCIALGRFSTRISVDFLSRSALVLLASIMLTRLDAFAETINVVLE
jgi:hypothetical protein